MSNFIDLGDGTARRKSTVMKISTVIRLHAHSGYGFYVDCVAGDTYIPRYDFEHEAQEARTKLIKELDE